MTELKKKLLTKKNILILICLFIIIIGVIIAITLSTNKDNKTANADNKTSTNKTVQSLTISGIAVSGATNCTIPSKVIMTDFLGLSLADIATKYGGTSQLNPKYSAQVITCENNNYLIRINFTNSKMIANYIEIQEKEFGTCDAGIDKVLPWVDKSMRAVGLDPSTKGTATYDTEDDRSQVEYDNYLIGDKNTYLTVECNITGNYIGVLAVLAS